MSIAIPFQPRLASMNQFKYMPRAGKNGTSGVRNRLRPGVPYPSRFSRNLVLVFSWQYAAMYIVTASVSNANVPVREYRRAFGETKAKQSPEMNGKRFSSIKMRPSDKPLLTATIENMVESSSASLALPRNDSDGHL